MLVDHSLMNMGLQADLAEINVVYWKGFERSVISYLSTWFFFLYRMTHQYFLKEVQRSILIFYYENIHALPGGTHCLFFPPDINCHPIRQLHDVRQNGNKIQGRTPAVTNPMKCIQGSKINPVGNPASRGGTPNSSHTKEVNIAPKCL